MSFFVHLLSHLFHWNFWSEIFFRIYFNFIHKGFYLEKSHHDFFDTLFQPHQKIKKQEKTWAHEYFIAKKISHLFYCCNLCWFSEKLIVQRTLHLEIEKRDDFSFASRNEISIVRIYVKVLLVKVERHLSGMCTFSTSQIERNLRAGSWIGVTLNFICWKSLAFTQPFFCRNIRKLRMYSVIGCFLWMLVYVLFWHLCHRSSNQRFFLEYDFKIFLHFYSYTQSIQKCFCSPYA